MKLAVYQWGRDGALAFCGASRIIVPDASEPARAGPGEELLTAEGEPGACGRLRLGNFHLSDRRPELYRALADTPRHDGDKQ